ncbi:hypothetical protein ACRRTK_013217 [Alexandromys fortis]
MATWLNFSRGGDLTAAVSTGDCHCLHSVTPRQGAGLPFHLTAGDFPLSNHDVSSGGDSPSQRC